MAEQPRSPIELRLEIPADQPNLLEGLETWLELGLITDEQVRSLCRHRLVCALPSAPQTRAIDLPVTVADKLPQAGPKRDFLPSPTSASRRSPERTRPAERPRPTRSSGQVNVWLQQLVGELSVVWLLGLGVFLVVLSSAVLAATQWAQFSAAGQYLVLLAYTGVFWAIGAWSATHPRLQLTSKTLQIIALLLVPLNLWAIDGLGVGRSGGGVLVAVVAVVLLSGMALQGLRRLGSASVRSLNFLGLTYLHLGWAIPWLPLVAVYIGSILSAAAILYRPPPVTSRSNAGSRSDQIPLGLVIFALGLLLLRSLTVIESSDWGQLGLAFGIYGAALVWLGQRAEAQRQVLQADVAASNAAAPNAAEPRATADAAPAISAATDASLSAAAAQPVRTTLSPRPLESWSVWGGRGLLWWGWLLAVSAWPAQALGVSILGLGLRGMRLGQLGHRRDLAFAFAISLQLPFLAWEILPQPLRAGLLEPLLRWTDTTYQPDVLLGITLFPYVAVMVAAADHFYRRQNRKLSRFSEGIAFALSTVLTLTSLASAAVLALNLIATTATALVATLRRPLQLWRVYSTHALALAAVVAVLVYFWLGLSSVQWTCIVLGLMAIELLLSRGRANLWQESAWDLGRGLAALGYLLLLGRLLEAGFGTWLGLLGLSIPLVLLLVNGYSASVLALGLTAPLTLGLPWTRLVGLGVSTGLAAANTAFLRQRSVTMLTVGFALGWVVSLLHDIGEPPGLLPNNTYWYLVGAIATLVLWLLWRGLPASETVSIASPEPDSDLPPMPVLESWSDLYRAACDRWGFILSGVVLLGITLESGLLFADLRPAYLPYALGLAVLMAAIFWRFWRRPEPLVVYSLGWAAALLVVEGLGWQGGSQLTLAYAVVGLGLVSMGLAFGLRARVPRLVPPLRQLALLYALLAVGLRSGYFTAWTGGITLVASLLALEVGRQARWFWLRWLALAGISVGWYELAFYPLSQATGGYPADGLVLLAGVALLIMGFYRLSAGLLEQRLGLPGAELRVAAHLHWGIGSLLLLLSAGSALISGGPSLAWLALGIALAFVVYALWQGKMPAAADFQALWIYLGLVELVGWIAYLRLLFLPLQVLDPWWGAVACALAVGLYWLPWGQWGWPLQPWRRVAVILPLSVLLVTATFDHVPSLWIMAGFYGWLAWSARRVRLSYLSLGLIIWAVWIWLNQNAVYDAVAQVAPLSLALIYAAQVDPAMKREDGRQGRHWFRVVGMGMVLVVALFSERWTGLPVGAMSLGAIALGLMLRTRAFLYVGTVIFGLNAINQLVLLNATYPFIKWVIGILVGVALIWIAADFERRRDQWISLTQGWVQELDRWA